MEYTVTESLVGKKGFVNWSGEPGRDCHIDTTEKPPCKCGYIAAHNIGCVHFFAWRKKQADWTVRLLCAGSRSLRLARATPFLHSLHSQASPPPSLTTPPSLIARADPQRLPRRARAEVHAQGLVRQRVRGGGCRAAGSALHHGTGHHHQRPPDPRAQAQAGEGEEAGITSDKEVRERASEFCRTLSNPPFAGTRARAGRRATVPTPPRRGGGLATSRPSTTTRRTTSSGGERWWTSGLPPPSPLPPTQRAGRAVCRGRARGGRGLSALT